MSPYSTSISNSKSNSSASPYSPPSSPLSPTITSPSSYMSVEQVLTKVAPGCITCDITGNIRIVDPPDEYYCCSLCCFEGGRCFQATDENNDSKGVHDDGNSNYKTRSSSNSNSSSVNINIDPFATCKNLLLNKNSCHYTMCEVSKHNTIESCWILAGNKIFDVTDFLMNHPGGIRSMLRYSGGVKDCTDDMNFHSRKSIKLWNKMFIGILQPCEWENNVGEQYNNNSPNPNPNSQQPLPQPPQPQHDEEGCLIS
ncbi:hypothetical protein ScalyP_jg8643 [Parmales sp. scaly parma]|nr:hypothetical protein ScalyP_jg8643 [Parmales sp. scaly parma]